MFAAPKISDIIWAGGGLLVFGVIAVPLGMATGLLDWQLVDDPAALLRTAAIALIAPAILEELVFRGPLIHLANTNSRWLAAATLGSLALFLIWHPLNGTFVLTAAEDLFTDWRFLMVAFWLGVVASALAIRTHSLWPPIVFHWLAVVGWKAFFGGPAFL